MKLSNWKSLFAPHILKRGETYYDEGLVTLEEIGEDEILPWDILDCGVSKAFLLRERHKAYRAETTGNCAEHCAGCGANRLGGDCTYCPKA